jgi:hypothetical protein
MAWTTETVADSLTDNAKCRTVVDPHYPILRHIFHLDDGALMHTYLFYGDWLTVEVAASVGDFDIGINYQGNINIIYVVAPGSLNWVQYSFGSYRYLTEIVDVGPLTIDAVATFSFGTHVTHVDVGYVVNDNGTCYLAMISYNGATWGEPVSLQTNFTLPGSGFGVGVTTNDVLCAALANQGDGEGQRTVKYTTGVGGGGTEVVSGSEAVGPNVDMVLDSLKRPHILYIKEDGANQILRYGVRSSGLAGGTWTLSDIAIIPPVEGWAETGVSFSLALNKDDDPTVAYGLHETGVA